MNLNNYQGLILTILTMSYNFISGKYMTWQFEVTKKNNVAIQFRMNDAGEYIHYTDNQYQEIKNQYKNDGYESYGWHGMGGAKIKRLSKNVREIYGYESDSWRNMGGTKITKVLEASVLPNYSTPDNNLWYGFYCSKDYSVANGYALDGYKGDDKVGGVVFEVFVRKDYVKYIYVLKPNLQGNPTTCLLYTSDAADD